MTTTPFAPYVNSTLNFNVAVMATSSDRVGNRTMQNQPVIIKAVLKPSQDLDKIQYYVGDDVTATLLEGYLVDPLTLPNSLRPPYDGTATIVTGIGRSETGKFKILPVIQSPYLVSLNINLVNKIRGIFTRA